MAAPPQTLLCLASYDKGYDFLSEAKRQGARVLLLTSLSLRETAQFPRSAIDDIFYMPDEDNAWNREHVLKAVSHLARHTRIDRIVPLDDFDLETAAFLREHLRLPGLNESQTRFFRDKLAMRIQAAAKGIAVPGFVGALNNAAIADFTQRVPGPWMIKPRMMAGAIGIKKAQTAEQLWQCLEGLGDQQSFYLIERFIPGDVYHVDSVVHCGKVVFAVASQYGQPPLDVSHGGGIFTTQLLERGTPREQQLLAANRGVMSAMGLPQGVSHTEFIHSAADDTTYFLETSARVGGANIADLIAAATGLNPWQEWARLECAPDSAGYNLPPLREDYGGLLVSLARQEHVDTSAYCDPEICWRMNKKNHVGLIVASPDPHRVRHLLEEYTRRVWLDFHTAMPAKERPTE